MAMDQRRALVFQAAASSAVTLTPQTAKLLIYFGSPLGRAEPMPSWSKVLLEQWAAGGLQ